MICLLRTVDHEVAGSIPAVRLFNFNQIMPPSRWLFSFRPVAMFWPRLVLDDSGSKLCRKLCRNPLVFSIKLLIIQ